MTSDPDLALAASLDALARALAAQARGGPIAMSPARQAQLVGQAGPLIRRLKAAPANPAPTNSYAIVGSPGWLAVWAKRG